VAEQSGGQTSITVSTSLQENATYYWRSQAIDAANNVVTPFSAARSFLVQSFRMQDASIWDNPPDLGSWPETARITSVQFAGYAMLVDFDKRTGPGKWVEVVPSGWDGGIQYNLGMCLKISGHWNCSAVVEFWDGRGLGESAPPSDFSFEWWFAPDRWGPMTGYRPQEGETVGVFVGAGHLRGSTYTRETCPRICERSNVVLVPFTTGLANYFF
jgi:hypothetical protein